MEGLRCILEGVANGIAYNRCLVGLAALAAVGSAFDILLGIIPGTTGVSHLDSHTDTYHQRTGQQAAQCLAPRITPLGWELPLR